MDEIAARRLAELAFRRHYRDIYGFLLRRTRDPHLAEDLAQSVFADASEALSEDVAPENLLRWLYAVAQRRLIDAGRQETFRRRRLPLLYESRAVDAERELYGAQLAQALERALGELEAATRKLVVLKLLKGWSFAEIGRELGISEDACKMRFSRAVTKLRRGLEEEGLWP